MTFSGIEKTGERSADAASFLEAASAYLEEKKDSFHKTAELANISALIFSFFEDLNWAGFYIFDGSVLILGPFQGEPACSEIAPGRGVCGTAALKMEAIIVPDVHAFEGHIACSSSSRSEIVVPIINKDGTLFGLIDLDSPKKGRFSEYEKEILTRLAAMIAL